MSAEAEIIYFIPKQDLHQSFVCLYYVQYKVMSETTDP